MNLSVIKQWFSLFFRGENELLRIGQSDIEAYLTAVISYLPEGVYLKDAVYSPLLNTLQVVAVAPAVNYGNFQHNTAEQYVRVISQAIYLLCRCLHLRGVVDYSPLKNDPESTYYRVTNLRYQRLIKPGERFVVTVALNRLRQIRGGIWQMNIAVTDGPFTGEIDGVLVPGGTVSTADPILASACYTIWQEIAHRLKPAILRFATQRIRRRLSPEAALFMHLILHLSHRSPSVLNQQNHRCRSCCLRILLYRAEDEFSERRKGEFC